MKTKNIFYKILFWIKKILWFFLLFIVLFSLVTFLAWFFKKPSNDRNWEFGMKKLAKVEKGDNSDLIIKNLRDFDWRNVGREERYKDFEFKLSDITGMEVGVSHFSEGKEWLAHVFTVFNLSDGRNIAVSIETRRDGGEEFGILKGMFFDYELIYILTTKEDLLSLREKRGERIYIYPIKTTPEKAQRIFQNFIQRVNELYQKPELYHIFFKNCTSLTVREVKKVSDKKFSWYEQFFTPGYSGKALFKMGLIDSEEKDFEKMREKFRVKFN